MNGIGILKYGNKNMVVGNWKESLFHGVIFRYSYSRNFWSVEEYDSGTLKSKVLEKEFEKDSPDNGKCFQNLFKTKSLIEIPYFFSSYIHMPHLYKDVLHNTLFSDVLKQYSFGDDITIINKIFNGEKYFIFFILSAFFKIPLPLYFLFAHS